LPSLKRTHAICGGLAFLLASACYWLFAEFRTGILGSTQEFLQPFAFVPYFIGALFGGNAHAPSELGFFLGLFAQCYLALLVVLLILRRFGGDSDVA